VFSAGAIRQGRSDHDVLTLNGQRVGQGLSQRRIGAERQVRAVLFGAAQRDGQQERA
jgi:hypothetical protein